MDRGRNRDRREKPRKFQGGFSEPNKRSAKVTAKILGQKICPSSIPPRALKHKLLDRSRGLQKRAPAEAERRSFSV
jgi:hypothetical protein